MSDHGSVCVETTRNGSQLVIVDGIVVSVGAGGVLVPVGVGVLVPPVDGGTPVSVVDGGTSVEASVETPVDTGGVSVEAGGVSLEADGVSVGIWPPVPVPGPVQVTPETELVESVSIAVGVSVDPEGVSVDAGGVSVEVGGVSVEAGVDNPPVLVGTLVPVPGPVHVTPETEEVGVGTSLELGVDSSVLEALGVPISVLDAVEMPVPAVPVPVPEPVANPSCLPRR